ncbi:hypothetical protein [Xanthomonas arboricola]|uniref:hypothetical protein n=1 Tax=Xanthomonas arboricola TaxID=56448 RepID=UPI000CEE07F1|nr:hypothetical protein [Xanthomonas arboricola]MBB6572142.1 hypothetical protein [Xanthomonas arboricola]PPT88318.1 hypothetical protein XarbCFBP8149_11420 [Xanthomonas arboricola]
MDHPALAAAVAILERQVAAGAEASTIASTVVAMLQQIDKVLTPILGPRGVAALFKRALFLTKDEFPWLDEAFVAVEASDDRNAVETVGVVLSQQRTETAAAGGAAFVHTFHAVLVSMIGPTLTERLLRSVWVTFSSEFSAQDIP